MRRIPFEVMVKGDKAPFYEETLEDAGRFNDEPVLPFNAYGTMALARGEFEANSGSSQVFWLLKVRAQHRIRAVFEYTLNLLAGQGVVTPPCELLCFILTLRPLADRGRGPTLSNQSTDGLQVSETARMQEGHARTSCSQTTSSFAYI